MLGDFFVGQTVMIVESVSRRSALAGTCWVVKDVNEHLVLLNCAGGGIGDGWWHKSRVVPA